MLYSISVNAAQPERYCPDPAGGSVSPHRSVHLNRSEIAHKISKYNQLIIRLLLSKSVFFKVCYQCFVCSLFWQKKDVLSWEGFQFTFKLTSLPLCVRPTLHFKRCLRNEVHNIGLSVTGKSFTLACFSGFTSLPGEQDTGCTPWLLTWVKYSNHFPTAFSLGQ